MDDIGRFLLLGGALAIVAPSIYMDINSLTKKDFTRWWETKRRKALLICASGFIACFVGMIVLC